MIPDAVKKQAEEAEELARKMAAEEQPTEEETPEEEEKGESAEVVDLPAEPQEEDWEHKYKVLQGKYNAEVPRLQEENRKLQDEMRLLREKLELLEQFIAQSQPKETPQAQPTSEVEDEAVKQLKEDFPDIYLGVTKLLEQFERRVSALLEEKVRPVQETVEQTTMATFQARLSSLVPDWTELNTDAGFLEWLKVTDPFVGKTRHEMLLEAFEARDADRVARFFQAYKEEQQTSKKRPSQSTLPPSGESYTPSVGRKPQGKVWTAQEVKDFYTNKALGKIPPKEASKIEAEILKAIREGRVQGTV